MENKIKLLLIEDSIHDARFFYEYITTNYSDEFEISHSSNLKSGIDFLSNHQLDIIITDLTLPDSSGLNTFYELRNFSKEIPVIILSGVDDKELTFKAIRHGAQDYINKGNYEGDFIYRVIRFAIERKKLTTQLEASKSLLQNQSEQLRKLNENLLELNRNKDKFYSIVAHDLMNPFSSLLGFSDLMVESIDNSSPGELKDISQKINRQIRRILTLIRNLLRWTALNTGKMEYKPETIKVNELLKNEVEFHQFAAKNKNIKLHYLNKSEICINADKFMIETVFRNLISNAIKFTNTNGNVTVRSFLKNNSAVIEFEDNGIGMSEEELTSLFIVGEGTSKQGTYFETGSGLGLILCKDFVIKNNGTINVKSELNKGAKFTVTFPAEL